MDRWHQAREEVIAGFESRTAESEIEHPRVEILGERVPEADGRTSIKNGRPVSIDGGGTLQRPNFGLKPLHVSSLADGSYGARLDRRPALWSSLLRQS